MRSPDDAMDSEQKAQFLLSVVEDRKAVEPVLLDLRGKTLLFDYCLVCSGTSNVHIRAIADAVLEKSGDDPRLNKPRATGAESAEWVLLDFGDVILHILDEDSRARYELEKFWSTPQPKGALPPTPGSVAALRAGASLEDVDALELDEEDEDDAEFFDEADQEVEPIDEDDDLDEDVNRADLEELDDEDLDDLADEDEEEIEEEEDGPQPLR